jgi:hypothetical protein
VDTTAPGSRRISTTSSSQRPTSGSQRCRPLRSLECVFGSILILSTGCTSVSTWNIATADLPADVSWIALFIEGNGLSSDTGTGFVHRDGDAFRIFTDVAPGASTIWALGFTDAHLRSIGAPSEVQLRVERIARERPSDPIIPTADWIGRGDVGGGSIAIAETGDPPPDLTVDWLPPCPAIATSTRSFVDWHCGFGFPCDSYAEQNGCDLSIVLEACQPGTLTGHLDGRGRASLSNPFPSGACQLVQPDPGAKATVSCMASLPGDTCSADIYSPTTGFGPQIDTATIAATGCELHPTPIDDFYGSLVGLAVLPDRVTSVAYDRSVKYGELIAEQCGNSTLVSVDAETLAVTRTPTAPPCLVALIADPQSDGYLGMRIAPSFAIMRIDRSGAIVASAGIPPDIVPLRSALPRKLVASGVSHTAAVISMGSLDPPVGPSTIGVFTLDPLAFKMTVSVGPAALPAGYLDDGRLAVLDRSAEGEPVLKLVDTTTGTVSTHASAMPGCLSSKIVEASVSGSGAAVIGAARGTTHQSAFVYQSKPSDGCRETEFFEALAAPWATSAWPMDPNLFLAGVDGLEASPVTNRAWLAFLDASTAKFLSGSAPIGCGPVRAMGADPKGRIWLTLPWQARIVRVTPRSSLSGM